MPEKGRTILFRGAGDFASGGIRRLHLAGFRVTACELPAPLCVRRLVSFSEAVYEGEVTVEGVTARLCEPGQVEAALDAGRIAVVVDPEAGIRDTGAYPVLVDGRMAKRDLGTALTDADFVVGMGPGFTVGRNCHAAVETDAGHDLGRVLWAGSPAQDTGRAAPPESYLLPFLQEGSPRWNWDRIVLRAPCDGTFQGAAAIGDVVEEGAIVGRVDGEPVRAGTSGLVRGLIRDGTRVRNGLKLGDVDPNTAPHRARTISEKANAIGGGILEAVLSYFAGRIPI